MTSSFNFVEDLLKPLASLPLSVLNVGTIAVPVPGLRNLASDALQWANPSAYEQQRELEPKISITKIGESGNVWIWIVISIVAFTAVSRFRKSTL